MEKGNANNYLGADFVMYKGIQLAVKNALVVVWHA
jgi:hypothetical protein